MESKRRKLTPNERKQVYDKMGGHCAYCGCEIEYKAMQVDHVTPIYWHNGADEIPNMLPACRSCNHYKSTMTIESFREALGKMPSVLSRDNVTYRNAVRYGLIEPTGKPVVFYYETVTGN